TGSHSIKAGTQMEQGFDNTDQVIHGDVNYTFSRGLPASITQYATPYLTNSRMRDLGIFAQDRWALRRLTINYGVRFDYFNGYVPKQQVAATRFVPARQYDPVADVPSWTDVNPRVGLSYDLFGDSRTA